MTVEEKNEIKDIDKQIETLDKRRRELTNKSRTEDFEKRKKHYYDNVHGKLFITIGAPYGGGKVFSLIRAVGCDDFESEYNSCRIYSIYIEQTKEGVFKCLSAGFDSKRVDSLTEQLTDAVTNEMKDLVNDGFKKMLETLFSPLEDSEKERQKERKRY